MQLTLILLTWTIWRAPTNASKWRMGFNSAFKGINTLKVYNLHTSKPESPAYRHSVHFFCPRAVHMGLSLSKQSFPNNRPYTAESEINTFASPYRTCRGQVGVSVAVYQYHPTKLQTHIPFIYHRRFLILKPHRFVQKPTSPPPLQLDNNKHVICM